MRTTITTVNVPIFLDVRKIQAGKEQARPAPGTRVEAQVESGTRRRSRQRAAESQEAGERRGCRSAQSQRPE